MAAAHPVTVSVTAAGNKTSNFASVKLPSTLVQDAREVAVVMRRSVAGQIEYWAALGRAAEHSGLLVQESREAIENFEAAAHLAVAANLAYHDQRDSLVGKFMAVEADGSLARQVRAVVLQNRSRALKKAA